MEKKKYMVPEMELMDFDMVAALLTLSIDKGEGSGGNEPQAPGMMMMDDEPDFEE